VSNIEWTVRSIREAIEAAQTMAGVEITTVYAGVAGSHIRAHSSDGVCAIAGREVTRQDLDRVLEGARAIPVDADRMILHALPREYVVDNQDGIRDPIGMSGVRLQARVNLVTAATSCVQNVVRCVERCGLQVAEVVLEPLASADAVLSDDEKEIGVAVIDIGGGTTDIAVYVDGAIVHTAVIPLGGSHVTSDIAVGLRTPLVAAEKIKKKYGCALSELVDAEETMEVPAVGGREAQVLSREILVRIIQPRVEEIFDHIKRELIRSGYMDSIAAGVVLTGGTTLLQGVPELAEDVLELPARCGGPRHIGGLSDVVKSPEFSTGVGLVRYGIETLSQHARPTTYSEKRGWRRAMTWLGEMF
jgi:cell division protein FtsA